ncbi:MAG: hypothetical protein L0228_00530 [Planctomycetes bacterium]|nr:hypothetical protein [Planctomycetota bacterium]
MSRRTRQQRFLSSLGAVNSVAKRRGTVRRARPLDRLLRFEPLEDRRLLANVTVGNTNDAVNGSVTSIADLIATPGADGISLREAVLAANADAAADVIDFSVTGTIQLTNVGHVGEIVINNDLTINGPGASLLAIGGFNPSATLGDGARIFHIEVPFVTRTVAISGLTLTGGDVASGVGGGAILNTENLTITNCTISGNNAGTTTMTFRGGGIANVGGNLSVIASTISGNTSRGSGAGIYSNLGSLNIAQSTVSGNAANLSSGGGIRSDSSTTTIDSSTISGNTAAVGGGIYGAGGNMTITNSTISGNSATVSGGGIFVASGNLTLRHSTVTLNRADSDNNASGTGGGLSGPATLDHTIVAGNLRSISTRDDISGAVTARYSLIGDNTGATITDNGGNQIGTGASPIGPLLSPLADNAGPTVTHALLVGSPAIDMGDPSFVPPPDFDQRGAPFLRVADGDGAGGVRIDVGAYERQTLPAGSLVVDTLADEDDGNYSAGDFSLREAISVAEGSIGVDTITFGPALTSGGPATILLMLGHLAVRDSLTINGPGANTLTIDASGNDPTPNTNDGNGSRVFVIGDGIGSSLKDVAISGLTLTGGDISYSGGAIFNTENLTVTGCTVHGNSASTGGGGIANVSQGELTINDSTISGNSTSGDALLTGFGGGIYSSGDSLRVSGSTISGNTSYSDGGGIAIKGGQLTLTHSTVTGNLADHGGFGVAGVSVYSGTATIDHTIIAGNRSFTGFDLHVRNGTATVRYCQIGFAGGGNFTDITGSQFNVNPLLGPLADNGGPTLTHALLAGSSAIDAGDSNFDPADPDGNPLTDDALPNDQRGAPFNRVFDGNSDGGSRIDVGAYELQPEGVPGDYNRDGDVNAADYVVWRKFLGTSVAPPFSGADGDGDSSVDPGDYDVWQENFGEALPGSGGGGAADALGVGQAVSDISASRPVEPELRAHDAGSGVHVAESAAADSELAVSEKLTYVRRQAELELHADRLAAANAPPPRRVPSDPTPHRHGGSPIYKGGEALRDDALLAWLASHVTERDRELPEIDPLLVVESIDAEDEDLFAALDEAFETVGDGVGVDSGWR